VWLGLPILLYAWSLSAPFAFDDLHLVLKTERYLRGESPELGLFRFAPTDDDWRRLRDCGTVPWWAHPDLRIDLFRPLAEWSFGLDMLLFGRNTLGHRAVSLLWFVLALLCAHRLFARTARDAVQAGIATFFLGISQTLAQPVAFVSNRSDLLVLVGTTLAANAYWRARTQPRKGLVPAAAGCFAFALLAKEMAVGLAGVALLHALAARSHPPDGDGQARAAARLRGLIVASFAILAAAYLIYYVASRPACLGLGDAGGVNLLSVLQRVARSIPLYLAVWTVGFPISVLAEASTTAVALVGSAGVLLMLLLLRHVVRLVRADPAALFFCVWAIVFLLIGVLTLPEARVLSVASVGWAYLLSGLLRLSEAPGRPSGAATSSDPRPAAPSRPAPVWMRYWLLTAGGMVSICCAIGGIVLQTRFEQQCRNHLGRYLAADGSPLHKGDALIVTEPESGLESMFAGDRLEFMTGVTDVRVVFLGNPGSKASVERRDERTLVVTAGSGDFFSSPAYRPWLGPTWPPRIGHTFEHRDFTAEVASVSADGRVTSFIFRFREPLTSPRYHYSPATLGALACGKP
jgi:hypothetical protein